MSRDPDAGPEPHLSHVSLFYTLGLVHNYILDGNRPFVNVGISNICLLHGISAEEALLVYQAYYYDYAQARDHLAGAHDNDNARRR